MDLLFQNPVAFVIFAICLVIAISVHEFSHALAADYLGDPTPRLQGRLTLNPLAHLDPFGTLLLFLAGFGWGKPVVFDPFNLRNPRRDAAIISLAGPVSNILIAVAASILLRLFSSFLLTSFIGLFLELLIRLNITLAVFNLIPIHPLDGFKIVGGFLSPQQAREWYSLERYGFILLFLLLVPLVGVAPISRILSPILNFLIPLFIPQSGFT